jgi:hypothetical protein
MTPTEVFERAGRTLFGEEYVAPLADYLGVEISTIDKWRDGKGRVPPEVWCDIFDVVGEQERAMGALRKELVTLVGARTDRDIEVLDGRQRMVAPGIFPAIILDYDLRRRFSETRRRR